MKLRTYIQHVGVTHTKILNIYYNKDLIFFFFKELEKINFKIEKRVNLNFFKFWTIALNFSNDRKRSVYENIIQNLISREEYTSGNIIYNIINQSIYVSCVY